MKRIIIAFLLVIVCSFALENTFRYTPNVQPKSVNLAGNFNNWSKTETPMADSDGDGTWEVTLDLPDGEYQYKFVINGETWVSDPNNSETAPDGFGGHNSVIEIGAWEKFVEVSKRGDGEILEPAIFHEQKIPYLCIDGEKEIWIRLRVKADDVQSVFLTADYTGGSRDTIFMPYLCRNYPFEFFEIFVPAEKYTSYRFLIDDSQTRISYPEDGRFGLGGEIPVFNVSNWAKGAFFYQIFPERFANGDKNNDPENVEPWGSKPEYDNFMGGDLQGIIDHVGYLDSLGIEAIYFNPLFEAGSNHKYDTHDYYLIDDNFGTNDLFKQMDEILEEEGIKIVLDGVFNHIGFGSEIFQDIVKKGEQSQYSDWFFIHSYPVQGPENPNYEAWWGFGSLPKLNTNNPEVREYLFGAIKLWLENGGDGWRLDVAPDVPHDFWKAFRDTIRRVDYESYCVGEIWGDGSQWLQGDEFDAVMNYRYRDACIEFFAQSRIEPSQFYNRLGGYVGDYCTPVNQVQLNLLGSHDTPRFLTIANNESWRLKLALFWTLIWPGAPCVYYGDEIGMTGDKDPGCRKAFPWDNTESWETDILDMIRYISGLRKMNNSLKLGTCRPLLLDDERDVIVIERRLGEDLAVIAVNMSDSQQNISVELLAENEFAPEDMRPISKRRLGRATEAFSGRRYYDPQPLEFDISPRDCMLFIVK